MNSDRIKKMRIPLEIRQLEKSYKDHGIRCTTLAESPDNYSYLEAIIPGPKESPYEEGVFKLSINCGEQYPFRPPTFKFVTPVYHPNIDNSGKICLDLLRMPPTGTYNPAITLESILLSIQLLLATPNPDDPLQGEAADLFKTNKILFNKKAREHVLKNCNDVEEHFSHFADDEEENGAAEQELPKKRLKLSCAK